MIPVEEVEGTEYLKGEIIELDAEGKAKEEGVRNEEASFSLMYMKDEEAAAAFKGAKKGQEVRFNAVKAFPNKTDFPICWVSPKRWLKMSIRNSALLLTKSNVMWMQK